MPECNAYIYEGIGSGYVQLAGACHHTACRAVATLAPLFHDHCGCVFSAVQAGLACTGPDTPLLSLTHYMHEPCISMARAVLADC